MRDATAHHARTALGADRPREAGILVVQSGCRPGRKDASSRLPTSRNAGFVQPACRAGGINVDQTVILGRGRRRGAHARAAGRRRRAERSERAGVLGPGRPHGGRGRQCEERCLPDHRVGRQRCAGPLCVSSLEARTRTIFRSDSGRRLRSGRRSLGERRGWRDHHGRPAIAQGPESLRAADQCGMARQHAGHGGSEEIAAQLRQLPYARADREVDARCRRVHGGHRTHVRLLPGQHSGIPAAIRRGRPAPARAGGEGDRRLPGLGQFEQGIDVELCAQDVPASDRYGHACGGHRI